MKKILVIEDEKFVRENVIELLKAEGFQPIEALNGLIGLEMARQSRPDLIICDIIMPELDGYGVLTALRADPCTRTIPFIFLTALQDHADRRQGMQLGADDYLTKPFTRIELLEAIAARLTRQAAIKQSSEQKLDDLRLSIAHSLPHELLTPLHIILMSSEFLIDDAANMEAAQVQKMAQRIHTTGLRLHHLIQNFLVYTELELIASDPQKVKALQNGEVCNSRLVILEMVQQKARQAGRFEDLIVHLQDVVVPMDDDKLGKMIEELVDNAFKYSPPGTPVRVTSTVETRDGQPTRQFSAVQAGEHCVVRITNSGHGLTTDQIATLGAYMQIGRKLNEQQGSGLGFSIARRLVELHGGELTVESVPNQQTTVTIRLPA